MDRYSHGLSKAGVNTANTVMWMIRTASADRVRIREIGISVEVAPTTPPIFVLARPTGLGATPTNTAFAADDPAAPAAVTLLDTAWVTPPTFTTTGPFLRRIALPVTAGSGIVWCFSGEGLIVPVSSGLIIANAAASGATLGSFGLYIALDE